MMNYIQPGFIEKKPHRIFQRYLHGFFNKAKIGFTLLLILLAVSLLGMAGSPGLAAPAASPERIDLPSTNASVMAPNTMTGDDSRLPVRQHGPQQLTCTATEVGGYVYREFKMNGAADPELNEVEYWEGATRTRLIRYAEPPMEGVTVNVYDTDNTFLGSAVTDASGAWRVDASSASGNEVRVEFVPPDGYWSGPVGADNATSVVMASLGSCDVNFTLGQPSDHCQDDPDYAVVTFSRNTASPSDPTIRTLASSEGIPHISRDPSGGVEWGIPRGTLPQANLTTIATVGSIGTTFGLDWDRLHGVLYTSAFDRAFAPMANDGAGGKREAAIYTVTPSGVTNLWLDLETLLGSDIAGVDEPQNAHPGSSVYGRTENSNVNIIGYTGLGSLKLANDNSEMYVVNLRTREVYVIPIAPDGSPPTDASQIKRFPLPDAPNCSGTWSDELEPGVNRPYTAALGLGVHPETGRVYATVTCTGPDLDDVVGHVYSFDPSDTTPSVSDFVHELTIPLYLKQPGANPSASNWYNYTLHPWERVTPNSEFYPNNPGGVVHSGVVQHSQPWLGEVAFDVQPDGTVGMIVSSRNRYHDLINGSYYVTGGQIFRACNTGTPSNPTWSLEVEGTCGNYTTGNDLSITPLSQYSNTHSKFFGDVGREGEMAAGTLTQVPGFAEVVAPTMDGIYYYATSGLAWDSNRDGTRSRDARILGNYQSSGYQATPFTKANNWGDVEALCEPAPLEIGDRVWCDDGNGTQDPGEPGVLDGLTVKLVCDTGGDGFGVGTDLVATTTTTNGSYLFNGDNVSGGIPYHTACRIIIDNVEPNNASILVNSCGTALPTATTQTHPVGDGRDEERDSDGESILGVTGVATEFTTGGPGENNHSYDFGFLQADADRGDLPDTFDTTIAQTGPFHLLSSDLYLGDCVDNDVDGQPDQAASGDDTHTGDPVYGTCATAGDDEDGVKLITPLIPGQQACVLVDAYNTGAAARLYGWIDFNGDGDFDGDANEQLNTGDFAGGSAAIVGNVTGQRYCFTVPTDATFDGGETYMRFRLTREDLSTRTEPWGGIADDGEVEDYWQPLACVGNYVWNDLYGTQPDVQDPDDVPLQGVEVRLVWAGENGVIDTAPGDTAAQGDDILYTTTTDGKGTYDFCGLIPATYQLQISTPPSDAPQAVVPDQGGNDVTDSDGAQPGGSGAPVASPTFTIPDPPNTLPTGENGNQDDPGMHNNYPDEQDDLTFDFGFGLPQVAIGDYVWRDSNGDGVQDSGEPGIENVRVDLLDSSGNPVQGCMNTNGDYLDEGGSANASSGSLDWSGQSWTYVNGGPYSSGGNPDAMQYFNNAGSMMRGVDLSVFAWNPLFSFDYQFYNGVAADRSFTVEYSEDGGATWHTLATYEVEDSAYHTASGLMIPTTSANAQIRFSGSTNSGQVRFDNIKIETCILEDVYDITDADGLYLFDERTGVDPSTDYQIVIDTNQPPLKGLFLTPADQGGDDAKDSDATMSGDDAVINPATSPATGDDLTYDFGFTTVAIGDYVWRDTNGDGVQDPGEPGIEGVRVDLLDSNGNPVQACMGTTGDYLDEGGSANASSGSLDWSNESWTYARAGYSTSSYGNPGYSQYVYRGTTDTTYMYRSVDLSVFAEEPTLSLDYRYNGTASHLVQYSEDNGATWNTLATIANTDGSGWQTLSVTLPSRSSTASIRIAGNDPSNSNSIYVRLDNIKIEGCLAEDVYDVTDADGLYLFDGTTGVEPNTDYQIVIDTNQSPLTGLILTPADQGGDDARDSDATMSGNDAVINPATSPTAGEDLTYDFGFTTVAIGDYVWLDNNRDGIQDPDESGIEGVRVDLLDSSGNPVTCHYDPHGQPGNYADDFETGDGTGSTGTLDWSNDWQAVGTLSWPVIDGDHAMRIDDGESASREFDMSVFPSGTATLSYAYRFWTQIDPGESVTVEYYDGSSWNTVMVHDSNNDATTFTTLSFTINSTATNTQLRIRSSAPGEYFYIDDIDISGTVPGPVSDVTDADGLYLFDGGDCVEPDTDYQIVIDTTQTPLDGLVLTTQNAGSDDAKDSDASMSGDDAVINPATSPTTGEDLTYDFGFYSPPEYDWGDLPDSFATDKTDDGGEGIGPSHVITSGLYLGSCVDAEEDGQVDATGHAGADGAGSGNGDDGNGSNPPAAGTCDEEGDDEDGVTLSTPLIPGEQACVTVTAHNATGGDATLYGWMDFNGDGSFDANEALTGGTDGDYQFNSGVATVPDGGVSDAEYCFEVPSDATFDGGETHMRFRLTTDDLPGASAWTGEAADGEVEDYWQPLVSIGNYLWMDAGSDANVQDSSDEPVPDGLEVNLVWGGSDGDIATDADNVTYTTTTTSGIYNFLGLVPDANGDGTNDEYQVRVPTLPGTPVTADQGGDDALDSDGDASGKSPVFTVSIPTGVTDNAPNDTDPNNFPDDNTDLTIDFGFQQDKVAIGNLVWRDQNGNSQYDSGEPGIEGLTVTLYQDSNGNEACEPGTDPEVASTTTDGDGTYLFLGVDPSTANDPTTNYCVGLDQTEVENKGYTYSSDGGAHNPDTAGDHDQADGDDGVPTGTHVVTRPFSATLNGQPDTSDSGDPSGYPDASSYMTVDFGFLTQEDYDSMGTPTAVTLHHVEAQASPSFWGWLLVPLGLAGLGVFFRRRQFQ